MENLYEILGVARTASNREINAALRQLVRRYNEETARGTRDSSEALKFVNHARLTFSDPERRADHDQELAAFEAEQAAAMAKRPAPTPEPGPVTIQAEVPEWDALQQLVLVLPPVTDRVRPTSPPTRTPTTRPKAPLSLEPALEPVLEWVLEPMPLDEAYIRKHFPGYELPSGEFADNDLNSVLAARDSVGKRSTAPQPLARMAARMIDYGVWGIFLALLLRYLGEADALSTTAVQTLSNPFIAPVIITGTWAVVEALLLLFVPLTPGKMLLDIRVALNVSNPYAANDGAGHAIASFVRSFRVWWRGMAAGIAPIYLATLLRSRRKLASFKETSWDFDSDCLVTHGKANPLRWAAAAILLAAGGWLYGNQWAAPFQQTVQTGWRSASVGVAAGRDAWRALSGDLPTYGKTEMPAPPAKENRTVALEATAQTLVDKRAWADLSTHCQTWADEEPRNASAWSCFGRARHEMADYGGAMTALKQAALLAPQDDLIRQQIRQTSLIDMQRKQMRKRVGQEIEQVKK